VSYCKGFLFLVLSHGIYLYPPVTDGVALSEIPCTVGKAVSGEECGVSGPGKPGPGVAFKLPQALIS
jgi:hypothetical protein